MKKESMVSIIIPNYNGERFIKQTIDSVLTNTHIPFELIVIDSNSTDKSKYILERYTDNHHVILHYLTSNRGPTYATNVGVDIAQSPFIISLGYDMEVAPNWLHHTLNYMKSHQHVGAGQLKVLRNDRRTTYDSAGEYITRWGFLSERAREATDEGQFDSPTQLFSGKGTALIFRKDVYTRVGGFDHVVCSWNTRDGLIRKKFFTPAINIEHDGL